MSTEALLGFNRDDLQDIAASLEQAEQTVNVGNVTGLGDDHIPTTEACAARFIRAALAAAPAGGAEPVALTEEYAAAVSDLAKSQDMTEMAVIRAAIRLYQAERHGTATVAFKREMSMLDDAAPTAQPQPQPDPTVLFDDRPQNQRIAEAEERMRNPPKLVFEDEGKPDDLITVAHVECENGASTLTLAFDQLGDLGTMVGEDEETYTVRIAPMTRADFEALGEFDGF